MIISVRNSCKDFNSYRAARVKSLFNCEIGYEFSLDANLPIDDHEWRIGLVVGPSGSGKTSIGRRVWPGVGIADLDGGWPEGEPIIDAILPNGDFNSVTAALAAVGLGSVPSWLRPFNVLSNGEKFRAGLARIICEGGERIIIDEFTSVIDRQIAKIGALAFQKSWRRRGGQCILLSCHYDIIEWIEPDWVFDTATGLYSGRGLWRRPKFDLTIKEVGGDWWPFFEPHHYLKLPRMVGAQYFVGFVDNQPVAHLAFSPHLQLNAMRACRMVVIPEWQGAGVGLKMLNWLCEWHSRGFGKFGKRARRVYFHTSHPGLSAALKKAKGWTQVSGSLFGVNKKNSAKSIGRSLGRRSAGGFGGHVRAVQGFRYDPTGTEL